MRPCSGMCSDAADFPFAPTVSDFGPLLLGRQRGLNATQEGVLALVFKIADDSGLLLLDLKNLRVMLQFVGDNSRQFTTQYGNVSAASIGAIQRGLLEIEQQGGNQFFGEPMLDINDLLQTDGKGRVMVNVLSAEELIRAPKLYSTFLLWMLSELFERLPEVGDPDKTIDRESAYEKLKARTLSKEIPARAGTTPADPGTQPTGFRDVVSNILFGTTGPRGAHHDSLVDAAAKSAARSFGSAVSRSIVRGALGSILGGSSRGRR
jgi:helicase HerA-like protein